MREKRRREKFGMGSVLGGAAAPDPLPEDGAATSGRYQGSRLDGVAASRQLPDDPATFGQLIDDKLILEPPYDPWELVCCVEESPTLPYLIDTIATNVGGFGVEIVPRFALRDEDGKPVEKPAGAEEQHQLLKQLVESCCSGGMVALMDKCDRDTEQIGWHVYEVLRDKKGKPRAFEHIRAYQTRLGRASEPLLVDVPYVEDDGTQLLLPRYLRFRGVVQVEEDGTCTWYKQFGDPRTVNRRTGEFFPAGTKLPKGEEEGTEVVWYAMYCPHSPYGVPRWIGGFMHARAEREAIDLVISWFMDAPIGTKLAMIAGGTWDKGSYDQAIKRIKTIAGTADAWTIVGLEGTTAEGGAYDDSTGASSQRIAFEDLTFTLPPELYHGDGNLIDESARRLARLFRLPPVYWGGSDDFSRAAVNGAKATAEEQVIGPVRRGRWEARLNGELLPAAGITLWRIKLRGASTTDDTELAKSLSGFVEGGGVAPNALIRLWNELTGHDIEPIAESWGDRPFALTTAILGKGGDPNMGLSELAAEAAAQQEEQAAAQAEAAARGGPPRPGGPPTRAQKAAIGSAAELIRDLVGFQRQVRESGLDGWWG